MPSRGNTLLACSPRNRPTVNAKEFLKRHLDCHELPETLAIGEVIAVVAAAASASADRTSDFDEGRIEALRGALTKIAETSSDITSVLLAKNTLATDAEDYS